jgi:hypothetical protein
MVKTSSIRFWPGRAATQDEAAEVEHDRVARAAAHAQDAARASVAAALAPLIDAGAVAPGLAVSNRGSGRNAESLNRLLKYCFSNFGAKLFDLIEWPTFDFSNEV